MKKYKEIIIVANLLLFLGFVNHSILTKETVLSEGTLVLLELAPVDPRSLMQGDYMRLNYAISGQFRTDSIPKRGYCVVTLTEDGVAQKVRVQEDVLPLSDGEYLVKYFSTGAWGVVNIGAESFFFQEGEGEKYEKGKYGALKIDHEGNSLLVGLYDEDKQLIE